MQQGIGDEFIIESYKIPWLIWIQLVITILLVFILFFGFTIFTSDSPSTSAVSPSTRRAAKPTNPNNPSSSSRTTTKVEDRRVRRDERELIREETQSEEEDSTLKDSLFLRIFRNPTHPCDLIKRAFFKCFGLDSRSDFSSSHGHDKQD